MPLEPITVELSDGQKIEALKRFYHRYRDELTQVEGEITGLLNRQAEQVFVKQYLGEQPEVLEMDVDPAALERLQKRRSHLGMLIDRLEQIIPKQGRDEAPATIQRF